MLVVPTAIAVGGSYNACLFPPKVGWNFAPLAGLPLDDGIAPLVGAQPVFGTDDDLVELFSLWRALQLGLTLALIDP